MQDTRLYRRPSRPQAQPLRPRRTAPRQRRPANWQRRIGLLIIILLAVVTVGSGLLLQRAIAFNDAVSSAPALSMRALGPFGPERVNVLLLGYSDESRGGAFLTDSMNVVSLDRTTGTVTMIPIPRDLWVEGIDQVPQNIKINEAFRIGYYADGHENGAELAAQSVTAVTGLEIHGWITLDFQGFEAMVDAIGGITLENPTAFAYTWAEEDYLAGNFQFAFEAGTIRLNGQQALDYARNRYTSVTGESSDFARSVRQQRVLGAIKSTLEGWDAFSRGLGLAEALGEHMRTNLSVFDLGVLAGELTPDRRLELAEGEILEATTNTIGQYVLVVIGRDDPTDYEPLHDWLVDQMAAPPSSDPGEAVP